MVFIIVDIDLNGSDFDVNNTDWIINGTGNKVIIFRLREGSNFKVSNGTITVGTGGIAILCTGVILSAYEASGSGDQVFALDSIVVNKVAFWYLNAVGEGGSNIKTNIKTNNGQGCAQFISQVVNFQNSRWN